MTAPVRPPLPGWIERTVAARGVVVQLERPSVDADVELYCYPVRSSREPHSYRYLNPVGSECRTGGVLHEE